MAVVNEKPIGVAHAFFQTRDVAWLEGVRVHPSYRGQGIAGKLNLALTRFAAEKGARVARLATASRNRASRRHLDKVGFKVLRIFQRLDSGIPLVHRPARVARPRRYDTSIWKWVRSRPELELFKEMYSDGWTWYPLNARSIQKFFGQRGVLQAGSNPPTSCSIFSSEERRFTVGFAAGPFAQMCDHARYMRYLLPKEKKQKVRALVPERSRSVDAFERAGYEKSGKALVYEKPLRPWARIEN